MKKLLILFMALALLSGFIVSDAIAKQDNGNNNGNPDEELIVLNIGTLYLFPKCDLANTDDDYDQFGCPVIDDSGPWPPLQIPPRTAGKLVYNLWGKKFEFAFEGRLLEPHTDYTLIYYPDPYPGDGLICLDSGTSNWYGRLLLHNKVETGSLPRPYDKNYNPISPSGAVGAKIWLVLSDDVNCGSQTMLDWNPAEYLFEYNLINFEDIDGDG